MRSLLAALVVAGLAATAAAASNPALLHPAKLTAKAPAVYQAKFTTTKGAFVVTVHRAWAPKGADRFYNLVKAGYYDGERLFRVVPGFVVQWGINGDPKVNKAWENATIKDDPVRHSNTPGTVTFAAAPAPNTRTTQVFVNLGSNTFLDGQGFAPFGVVTSGGATINALYRGYGDRPTKLQGQMEAQGETYFAKAWPKLDRILNASIIH